MAYAIVRAGGRQVRVEPGQTVDVDRLDAAPGDTVELSDVLLVSTDGQVRYGAPCVDGVRVVAQVVAETKAPKIIVFKYKSKTRYRRKTGHRQKLTRLRIQDIVG